MTDQTTPAPLVLREQVAAAIYERNNPGYHWADAHPDDRVCYGNDADAAVSVLQPGAQITAPPARMSEDGVQRVIALCEQWVKAGPPPLGTQIARWWDKRLVELHNAIQQAGPDNLRHLPEAEGCNDCTPPPRRDRSAWQSPYGPARRRR